MDDTNGKIMKNRHVGRKKVLYKGRIKGTRSKKEE